MTFAEAHAALSAVLASLHPSNETALLMADQCGLDLATTRAESMPTAELRAIRRFASRRRHNLSLATHPLVTSGHTGKAAQLARTLRLGRLGKCRRPIHASALMCLATSSTDGLRTSCHHLPTNVTMPTRAWA